MKASNIFAPLAAAFLSLAPSLAFLTACATPADRSETRQATRVEGRTEERQERHRD